jgi:hypothetical protein
MENFFLIQGRKFLQETFQLTFCKFDNYA